MELDFLPATVYRPQRSGPDPGLSLNITNKTQNKHATTMEGGAEMNSLRSLPKLSRPLVTINPPVDANSDNLMAPNHPVEAASPSSSVASVPLTWMSSDAASSVDTGTDFEDLYDPAEMTSGKENDLIPVLLVHRPDSVFACRPLSQVSDSSAAFETIYPTLVDPTVQHLHRSSKDQFGQLAPQLASPIQTSPAVAALLNRSLALPSAPPSLDGSSTSEQLAQTEAPSTPLMPASDQEQDGWDGGIQLNPEALATLKFLSGEEEEEDPTDNALPARDATRRKTVDIRTAECNEALNGLTRLEIPSPRDFLSSLTSGARHTWCPTSAVPLSSTTAEKFYMCPWSRPTERTVEQIIEVDDADTEGPPTAQLITPRPVTARETDEITLPVLQEVEHQEVEGAETLDMAPSASLDRTRLWLSAQLGYEDAVKEDGDDKVEDPSLGQVSVDATASAVPIHVDSTGDATIGKESDIEKKRSSIYLRGFMHTVASSRNTDAFTHSQPRFDAMQTQRICEPWAHRDQLQGVFRHSERKPVMAEFEDHPTEAQITMAKVEDERDVLRQLSATGWNAVAARFLNGGKLFVNPSVDRMLRRTRSKAGTTATYNVLDLGGQAVGDWAWHCAAEYPAASVTTVTASNACGFVNSWIEGPPNHQHLETSCLWNLPFPDGYFDVISVRSVHMLLKVDKSSSSADDEYDMCLRECWRCLKPGGYLDFNVLDSELMNAGPLGTALSVEFGFNLRTRGYDANPTRTWLQKLKKAGFGKMKRTWMFLPMGTAYRNAPRTAAKNTFTPEAGQGQVHEEVNPCATGSTDAVACLTGLVGLWAWERWLVKLQVEAGKSEDSSLDRVSAVVEEGREHGAGWSCLSGWAMKPLRTEGSRL